MSLITLQTFYDDARVPRVPRADLIDKFQVGTIPIPDPQLLTLVTDTIRVSCVHHFSASRCMRLVGREW